MGYMQCSWCAVHGGLVSGVFVLLVDAPSLSVNGTGGERSEEQCAGNSGDDDSSGEE